MKEYQFQFTKVKDTFLVVLACIVVFAIVMFICVKLSIDKSLMVVIELIFMFLTFRLLKKKAVSNCTAKLNDTSIQFEFENDSRSINFSDLISYKAYYGKNGAVLYLKNNIDNFKISVNSNYCKTDDFELFCKDVILKLDTYKDKTNSIVIHEGSIFTKKGMLYFLITATLIYLLAFFIETKDLRIGIGIGGGFYFFIMWTKYFIENNKLQDQNGS